MKTNSLIAKILIVVFSLFFIIGYGQENAGQDSVSTVKNSIYPIQDKYNRKNSLSLNITNPLLLSIQFQTVAYERVFNNNQSFTVSIGKFSIPKFGDELADSLGMNTDYDEKGFHFGFDYRFYLKKENKYEAPRGVYIGPFYTYNYLNRENSWYLDADFEKVFTNIKFNIHTVGVELGYQFVFWDRMSVDMIMMGPGVGFYGLKTEIGTNLDQAGQEELFQKLNDLLADIIPGYDNLIEPGAFKKTGNFSTVDVGFRYVVRVGFRF